MTRDELMRTVEGPQRGMPRHIFSALSLSLLLLGCACGPAYAWGDAPVSVSLFEAGTTKVPEKPGVDDPKRDVSSFDYPFLVAGKGVMVAVAEARCANSRKERVDIVARYIETVGENWASKTVENNGDNWKTQLVLQGKTRDSVLRNPTAVIKDNKIYLLALNNRTNDNSQNGNGWHFELAVGEITGEVGSKKIEWEQSESLSFKLAQEVEKQGLTLFLGSGNSAFLRSKGTIVFSANATNREGERGYAILQLEDDKEQWEVSFTEKPKECHSVYLFEWKGKLISVFSDCPHGKCSVKEYDEIREEWRDAEAMTFCPWDDLQEVGGVTPVTIGNKTVVLFTQNNGFHGDLHLWVTDGSRVHDVGVIAGAYLGSKDLLYTNGELFLMYLNKMPWPEPFVFARLNYQLKTIKPILDNWEEKDAYFSRPCNETAPQGPYPEALCVTPMPTDGLVGFLSNNSDAAHWHDEYRFTNATVRGGVKVKNGFTFSEAFSGALWPVGERYSSYKNNFARYGLTVVATVIVHETPKDDASLLTVDGTDVRERLGLWHKDKQWKVVSTDGKEERAVKLRTEKEYRVALMLQSDTISVYVDGKFVGGPLPVSGYEGEPFDIENIYICGYNSYNNLHMTVTNVLLYKRALDETELEALGKKIATTEPIDSEEKNEQATGQATGQTTETLTDSTGEPTPAPEATNKTEAAPVLTNKAEAAPEATNKTEAAPVLTNKAETVPEATNKKESAPEATNKKESAPEATNKTEAVPEARGMTESAPVLTNKTKAVPEATNMTQEEPKLTNTTRAAPESAETTKMPTDPEDSSVGVRMSLTSLFLLGCFCLAIF